MDQEIRQDPRPGGPDPHAPAATPPPRHAAPPPRPRPRAWLWVLLGAAVVGLAVWLIVGHAGGGSRGERGPGGGGRFGGMPTAVATAEVQRGDVPIYLNELGAVTPLATVTVTSQISGYLQQIGFSEGQMVRRGQFLAQIDPRPYQAQLLQAEGALARDEAQLAEARLDLKRYQTLLAQDSIASQQVDTQSASVKQLEGTIKTDQANIATARLNIAYCHITSPVTGRVGLRQVDVGNYVTPGATNGIVVVTELTPIDVEFTMPEDNLPQVQARLHAGASLPVTAYDRAGATELALGKLLTLDNQIDPTTGTVKAKARFDNAAGDLFPQQFVNARILVDTLKGAVVAPTSAILRGGDGLFAYAVQGGVDAHAVTVRNLKTGPADGERTAILSGLQPGDVVVTDGSDKLREGAKVILPGDCIPAMPQGGRGRGRGRRHDGEGSGGAPAGGRRGRCPAGQQPAGRPAVQSDRSGQQSAPTDLGGENRGPGGRTQAMLAQLDLDADQQLKAQAIFTAARGQVITAAAASGGAPEARRDAVRQVYGRAFDQLAPILRPDQRAKLDQLRAELARRPPSRDADRGAGSAHSGATGGEGGTGPGASAGAGAP